MTDNLPSEDKEVKLSTKGRQRWNIFQRGNRCKAGDADSDFVSSDPVELQRVSFATSIDDLPARPSAFQQVLRQIGANKNSPGGLLKMAKVPNFKKLVKDGKSATPQGRHSIGTTSSFAPKNLDVPVSRPRSSSNSSFTGEALKTMVSESEKALSTSSSSEKTNAVDLGGKVNESTAAATVTSSLPPSAGPLLLEANIQPTVAPLLGAANSDSMPSVTGNNDVADSAGAISEQQRNKQLAEHLKQKIMKTSEAIKNEQLTRDENVKEYLKLASNADKQQASRIKSVFEKKNQKSNANISQLQKKLDSYHRKLREIDSNGPGKQGRLRDVGANIRDFSGGVVGSVKGGLSGLHHATKDAAGAIASKPKGIASRLKNRFGSADNLPNLSDEPLSDLPLHYESADDISSTSGSIDNIASIGSASGLHMDDAHNNGCASLASVPDSPTFTRKSESRQLREFSNQLLILRSELEENKKIQSRLKAECEMQKKEVQESFSRVLEEEKIRFEVQLNDLVEMHQREISSLKQEITSMEEKVEYHAHERARDAQEALETCQTRIAKMELQQQQLVSVSVEGLQSQNAKALLGKLINLLLSVMAVLLVLVSTASRILMPFMRSQRRLLASSVVIISFVITYKNWNTLLLWYEAIMGR